MLAFLALAFAADPVDRSEKSEPSPTAAPAEPVTTEAAENTEAGTVGEAEGGAKAEAVDKADVEEPVRTETAPVAAPTPAPVVQTAPPPLPPPSPPTAPSVPKKAKSSNPVKIKANGIYSVWGLTQNNFLFGKDHPLDDSAYTVQMMRLKLQMHKKHYGMVMRADGGQGWWGADNSPNTGTNVTVDENGVPVGTATYNPGAFFTDKDTNYAVHVDWAYAWADVKVGIPIQVRVGRQYYRLGHRLVLDMNMDGVQVELKPSDDVHIGLWWAKISEGLGSFTTPKGTLMSDDGPNADADMAALVGDFTPGKHKIQVFGAGYWDRSGGGMSTYFPQGLGYLRSRHQPNISTLYVGGVSADLNFPDVGGGLKIEAEADVLVGQDNVNNADYGGGKLDRNDGHLFGFNGWFKARQSVVKAFSLGAAFGVGSGDRDKTSGVGNVNKIQTMGFFPLTNIWEDSVMPDIAGISPQGLGSPVSRGYRELENTIAAQAFTTIQPIDPLKFDVSYTFLRATTPIQGFDATGAPTGSASSDIGMEVDVNTTVKVYKGLSARALTGIFLPGQGAANLINGNADHLDSAWEVKLVGLAKF